MTNVNDNSKSEPIFNLPPVVQTLCLLNVGIYLFEICFPGLMTDELIYKLAFVPARYTGTIPFSTATITSPLTHMFIHAGWLHLIINVGTLMAFGAGIEKAMGGRRMLLFYLLSGFCGVALHTLVYPHAEMPLIGASGAISGLFGGIIMMMYGTGMMGSYKKLLPIIFLWIGVSLFFGFFGMPGVDNPIAWTAHVGGFIGGLLLYKPICRIK